MTTRFARLNKGWNAEPNVPEPCVEVVERDVAVTFFLNPSQFPQFREGERARLCFHECWRYRLGSTNDEGWYRGQCRFSGIAPAWGEFYEVSGDLKLGEVPGFWIPGPVTAAEPSRHFLFYFRDDTFECDAAGWRLDLLGVDPSR
jgi:hypothetical protein